MSNTVLVYTTATQHPRLGACSEDEPRGSEGGVCATHEKTETEDQVSCEFCAVLCGDLTNFRWRWMSSRTSVQVTSQMIAPNSSLDAGECSNWLFPIARLSVDLEDHHGSS